MLPIQPWRRRQRNKKLTPIRVRPAVRHAQHSCPRMLETRVGLVFEFFAVDRAAPAAGAGRVARLKHEVWDYAVKEDVVVVAALGEGGEVLAGLWGWLLGCVWWGGWGVGEGEGEDLGGVVVV